MGGKPLDLTGKVFGDWKAIEYGGPGTKKYVCQCIHCGKYKAITTYGLTSGRQNTCRDCATAKNKVVKGMTFGDWEVLGPVEGKNTHVVCKCSCGTVKEINKYTLLHGLSTNCGHLKNLDRVIDLKGQTFGDLEVLEYLGDQRWKCKCSCGEICIKSRNHLLDGRAHSCGHGNINKFRDVKGLTFGNLKALEYLGHKKWLCECKCGNTIEISQNYLIYGYVQSCGKCQYTYGDYYDTDETYRVLEDLFHKYGRKLLYWEIKQETGWNDRTVNLRLKRCHNGSIEFVDNRFSSYGEETLYEALIKIGISDYDIQIHNRTLLKDKEIDIYIPKYKLAIEYNGVYWHQDAFIQDKKYHLNKTIQCHKNGIRLIHIFEDQWMNSSEQKKIISIIKGSTVGNKHIVYGRDTTIVDLSYSDAKEFLKQYHMQGQISSKHYIGCIHKDLGLIGVMAFGASRFELDADYELHRLCWKFDVSCVGGAEKMQKYFETKYKPKSIVTYSDLSMFNGSVYDRLGYKYLRFSGVGYFWTDGFVRIQRYEAQKKNLLKNGLGTQDMTEDEIMEQHGYMKIYNCGNLVYLKNLEQEENK